MFALQILDYFTMCEMAPLAIDVVGLGSLNFDFIFKVDNLAKGDQQVVIKETYCSPGGSCANTIFGLAKLPTDQPTRVLTRDGYGVFNP